MKIVIGSSVLVLVVAAAGCQPDSKQTSASPTAERTSVAAPCPMEAVSGNERVEGIATADEALARVLAMEPSPAPQDTYRRVRDAEGKVGFEHVVGTRVHHVIEFVRDDQGWRLYGVRCSPE